MTGIQCSDHSKTQQRIYMNNYNLALGIEQNQRIIDDKTAQEQQIEKLTNLYHQGVTDAAFFIDPVFPEIEEYWQGYCEEKRRYWIKQNNPMPNELYQDKNQGCLYATAWELEKKYGKISVIGAEKDYKGWQVEIEGLKIEIVTFDWEEAEKETKWAIYAHHCDALSLLCNVFGNERVDSK